jgi:tetratricopeptide (TPR) repeat protein
VAQRTTGWARYAFVAAVATGAAQGSFVRTARAQEPAEAPAEGEPGTRERQAAAEAYDKGSTAYLAGDYTTAAQWFETAHRMAPNSAALLQATRAYEHAEHLPRAATLALQIVQQYSEDAEAVAYAQGLLEELAPRLVRIDVSCEGCRLELEGKLIEQSSFFIEPGKKQRLVAEFDTGRRVGNVHGDAGTARHIELAAPAEGAPPPPVVDLGPEEPEPKNEPPPPEDQPEDRPRKKVDAGGKPFGPLVTWIGVGITGVALGLSVVSTIDMYGGVGDYENAAKAAKECTVDCAVPQEKAQGLLEDGQATESRTTILWIATGGAAAVTGVIALFLTDWSGGGDGDAAGLRLDVRPLADGATGTLSGRF